jgi:hypothetical protein
MTPARNHDGPEFGLLIDVMGGRVLMVSSALSLAALMALSLIKRPGQLET